MELQSPFVELSDAVGQRADEALRSASRARDPGRLREAAEQFEAVFIAQMLAPMLEGLETDGIFGGGSGEQVYRSMLVEEYGKAIARSGGLGIADQVERELLKLQETPQ